MTAAGLPRTFASADSWRAARLSRDLHPVAWWVWALGLASAASYTLNPIALALLIALAATGVFLRRSDQPWARSFRLYVWLGVFIVVIRVIFRIVFGGLDGTTVLFNLPEIPLPDFAAGVRLLGPVTRESLLSGFYDGLRLATIVICIGAANSLANPKRLLRSVPPALYEIGTALVVAVTVLPQFADSARRVRAAQALRGGPSGRFRSLRRLVVPILEDALGRSLRMASGMDSRGYGRPGDASPRQRAVTGAFMLVALCGICVGTYALLDSTAPRWLALPMLGVGAAFSVVGLVSAGQRVTRSRYRPDRWRWPEFAVMASGIACAAVTIWVANNQVLVAFPGLEVAPYLSPTALLGLLIAMIGPLCAPPPPVGVS